MKGDTKKYRKLERGKSTSSQRSPRIVRPRRGVRWADIVDDEDEPVKEDSSSSTVPGDELIRGEKRDRKGDSGDVEYDEEGSRLNSVKVELEKTRKIGFRKIQEFAVNVEELDHEAMREAFDDVTGDALEVEKVAASRAEDRFYAHSRNLGSSPIEQVLGQHWSGADDGKMGRHQET